MQWHPHSPTSSLYPCDCITVTKMEVNDICNPLIFYLGEATRGLLWSADPPVPRDAESGKLNLEINYPLIHPLRKQLNHQYIRLNCLKMCYIHIWITLDQNNCCAGASLPSSTEAFKESHTHILFPEADQCIAMLNFKKIPELLFYLNFLQEYLEFPSRSMCCCSSISLFAIWVGGSQINYAKTRNNTVLSSPQAKEPWSITIKVWWNHVKLENENIWNFSVCSTEIRVSGKYFLFVEVWDCSQAEIPILGWGTDTRD